MLPNVRCRTGAVLAIVVALMFSAAGAHARSRSLDDGWGVNGPPDQQWLAADANGVAALGRGGELMLVDAEGEMLWYRAFSGEYDYGPLAMGEQSIVVPVRPRGLFAADRTSSDERWWHPIEGARAASVAVSAAGSVAAVATDLGVLEVVDEMTGSTRWTASFEIDEKLVHARVWVTEERVLLAWTDRAGSHLLAFAVADGAPAWAHEALEFFSMPIVTGRSVSFAENTRLDRRERRMVATMRSVDLIDGRELWAREVRSPTGFWSAVATAGTSKRIAMLDMAGTITVVDAMTGKKRWRVATDLLQYEAEPYVVGSLLALTTYGTGLELFGMKDGQQVPSESIPAGQTALTIETSAASGDRLYLAVSTSWGDSEIWMLEPD